MAGQHDWMNSDFQANLKRRFKEAHASFARANLTTKVQYRGRAFLSSVGDMKKVRSGSIARPAVHKRRIRNCNFRDVARFHALGLEAKIAPERKRLIDLALNEAEALACQTGVPELVLLTLAEEKVRAARQWLARQEEFKNRSLQWQLAA
jgi:hypothetical protein